MSAIVQRRYRTDPDDLLGLETVDVPKTGDDEMRLRVRAAGVDRGTWRLMAGRHYDLILDIGVQRAPWVALCSSAPRARKDR